jgi:hypothetical protein
MDMILFFENRQSMLSFLIALLRPRKAPMDAHCNTPLPTAAPDFAQGADLAPKLIVRCVRGAAIPGAPSLARSPREEAEEKFSHSQSPDKSENAEEISFPRSGGHSRQRRRTRDRRFRREPSRCRGCRTVGRSPELSRAMEKPLDERGFVEGHIFEFRPSRNDAVDDRVYSPRSLQKKAPMALISFDAKLKSAPRAAARPETAGDRAAPAASLVAAAEQASEQAARDP